MLTEVATREPEAIEKVPEDLQTAIGKLMPFANQAPDNSERAIPYEIRDYLDLVDWSSRAVIDGKRGSIPDNSPPILQRLKIDPAAYVKFINRSEKRRFSNFIGPVEVMRNLGERFGESFLSAAYSPSLRSETLSGGVAGVLRDRVHRRRTPLSVEDARPSETPQMRGVTAPQ